MSDRKARSRLPLSSGALSDTAKVIRENQGVPRCTRGTELARCNVRTEVFRGDFMGRFVYSKN